MQFVVSKENYAAADFFHDSLVFSALASFIPLGFICIKTFKMFLFVIWRSKKMVLETVCASLECVCLQQPYRQIQIKNSVVLLCKHSHWVQAAAQANISPQHSWLLSELRWFSAPVGTSCGLREGLCHFSLTPLHVILYLSEYGNKLHWITKTWSNVLIHIRTLSRNEKCTDRIRKRHCNSRVKWSLRWYYCIWHYDLMVADSHSVLISFLHPHCICMSACFCT